MAQHFWTIRHICIYFTFGIRNSTWHSSIHRVNFFFVLWLKLFKCSLILLGRLFVRFGSIWSFIGLLFLLFVLSWATGSILKKNMYRNISNIKLNLNAYEEIPSGWILGLLCLPSSIFLWISCITSTMSLAHFLQSSLSTHGPAILASCGVKGLSFRSSQRSFFKSLKLKGRRSIYTIKTK